MLRANFVDLLAELARIAVELVEAAALAPAALLRPALGCADVLAVDAGVADLGVAEPAGDPRRVRGDACAFPPLRSVAAGVEGYARIEGETRGAALEQRRERVFYEPEELRVLLEEVVDDLPGPGDEAIGLREISPATRVGAGELLARAARPDHVRNRLRAIFEF